MAFATSQASVLNPWLQILAALEKTSVRVLHGWLNDNLLPSQVKIYQNLGGPKELTSAFYSDIELDKRFNQNEPPALGVNTGGTRAVELIPSQTAINVNQAHSLTSSFSLAVAYNAIFGFGAKGDYEQQREKYDQFMQQEVFASAFGKGQATFGWTFGPTPGTRILNNGVRSTYAVLTVPDDTTTLELEGIGCAFPRKANPPADYPYDLAKLEDFHCGTPLRVRLGVPDQINSGAFWVTGVNYDIVQPGQKSSVIVRGSYLSPQTTVLVDGHRLTQVVGVGKPLIPMDDGPAEPADDSAISGTFEYVDNSQMVLNLLIPKNYAGDHFPIITLVSPSRVMPINDMTLLINGSRTHLSDPDQSILVKPDPPAAPSLGFTGWQVYDSDKGSFTARLTRHQLTSLGSVWMNGKPCKLLGPKNGSTVTVTCLESKQAIWEFQGETSEADPRTIQMTQQNPRLISMTSYSVTDGSITYDAANHPDYMEIDIAGVGFTPLVKAADERFLLSYVSPTQLHCSIRNPKKGDTITLVSTATGQSAALPLKVPPDLVVPAAAKAPAAAITVTTVHKEKVVSQQ